MTPNGASIRIPFMFFSKIIFAFVSFFSSYSSPLERGGRRPGCGFRPLSPAGLRRSTQSRLCFGKDGWWVVLDFLHDLKSPRNLPLFSFFQYLFSWFRYQRQPLSVFVGKVYIEKWRMSIECPKFCSSKYFFSTY